MRDLWLRTFRVCSMRMRSVARLRVHKKLSWKEKECLLIKELDEMLSIAVAIALEARKM